MIVKKLFLVLLLIAPLFANAQRDDVYGTTKTNKQLIEGKTLSINTQDSLAGTSIIIKNNEVIYSKVFEVEAKKTELINLLKLSLPNIAKFEFKIDANSDDKINGNLNGTIINYRKYGGTLMGTNVALNYPLVANVIIQVKDNKYRVLVTNMYFKDVEVLNQKYDLILDDGVTRKKRTEFKDSSQVESILKYIDKHLTDTFNVKRDKIKDDF
ncbi:MAG: hypothetical protein EOO44_06245 [Flavobacterium sp.]|nr:MAG: hypothetical protein EOO44_06245 [Flavobacterium sp.]